MRTSEAGNNILSNDEHAAAVSHIEAIEYKLRAKLDRGQDANIEALHKLIGEHAGIMLTSVEIEKIDMTAEVIIDYCSLHYPDFGERMVRSLLALRALIG